MADQDFYVSRKSAQRFLRNFQTAINEPQTNPLLFYVYGIGGIGKSTLLEKLRETHENKITFATAFFGPTSTVETSIGLMKHLYEQLPKDDFGDWGGYSQDRFQELCKLFFDTYHQLETEPVKGRGAASSEQINLVKSLLVRASTFISEFALSKENSEKVGKAVEGIVDTATLALNEKDRIGTFLKQHRATKEKRELQELMLDPVPRLVKEFITGLIQKSRNRPIVLLLDTYEKASAEFNEFLCKFFLGDQELQPHPVRIVMAGRYSLKNKQYHRIFQYHWDLIDECELEKFDKNEAKIISIKSELIGPVRFVESYKAQRGFLIT